jgi:hypothetical protein
MQGTSPRDIVMLQANKGEVVIEMIKKMVAQLKQCPELLNLLLQDRVSLVGVSAVEQRALVDVLKTQLDEPKKGANYWM